MKDLSFLSRLIRTASLLLMFTLPTQCLSLSPSKDKNSKIVQKDKEEALIFPSEPEAIQPGWRNHFLSLVSEKQQQMSEDAELEAWALFSSSGWVDQGQSMIISTKSKKDASLGEIFYAGPNRHELSSQLALNATDLHQFSSSFPKYYNLKNRIPVVFDALEYEFIHVVANKQKKKLEHRLVFRMLGIEKDAEEPYSRLVQVFKAWLPKLEQEAKKQEAPHKN
ncbi:MAG: hypothetical protein KA436_11355 [Oligoflexales bacterium]|nr:hypothetical protein [Oligoflexales bacterium]